MVRGLSVFLGKELTEIRRTWRLYVVPGILVFFGLTSPLIAHVTPALISNMMGAQGQGIVMEIPPATTVDAYLQWSKNAMQIALFAIIIASAGSIAAERKSGTAQLVLTKPVSRSAMVLAKIVSNCLLVLFATIASALLCIAVTSALFDTTLLREFAAVLGVWYLIACLMVTLTVLLSVLLTSQAGASGVGLAAYFVMSVAAFWRPARDYSPVGLFGLGDRILTGAEDLSVLWPVLTGLLAIALLAALACSAFSRQEL